MNMKKRNGRDPEMKERTLIKRFKVFIKKIVLFNKSSKSERLIYLVMLLWVFFGIMGIRHGTNLTELAGYYASLSLFVGSYLWGEYKRGSKATKLFEEGPTSPRETIIYFTLFLWVCLGLFGILKKIDINTLTVYFSSLSPFVSSFIIYKTSKGKDPLPIFDGTTEKIRDKALDAEPKSYNDDYNNFTNDDAE